MTKAVIAAAAVLSIGTVSAFAAGGCYYYSSGHHARYSSAAPAYCQYVDRNGDGFCDYAGQGCIHAAQAAPSVTAPAAPAPAPSVTAPAYNTHCTHADYTGNGLCDWCGMACTPYQGSYGGHHSGGHHGGGHCR